ncbi:MAG: hypothetical protein ACXWEY_14145, partial [Bacteroidia bacterium]
LISFSLGCSFVQTLHATSLCRDAALTISVSIYTFAKKCIGIGQREEILSTGFCRNSLTELR